jgi:hypothetical protein
MAASQTGVYFFAGTLLNAAWLGGYIGLCGIYRTNLWLAAGVAMGIAGLAFICGCFCLFTGKDVPKPNVQIVLLFIVVFCSATFAGLLGGAYYQEYWHYSGFQVIKDVNVNDVEEMKLYNSDTVAMFKFIPETRVMPQYGYAYDPACVAPILIPPYHNDSAGKIPVKFWAVGASCCSGTYFGGCESWASAGLVGIIPRSEVEKTKDAAARAVLSQPNLVVDPNPVYVAWMSESQVTTKADKALVIGQVIIGLHFPLWWIWALPVFFIVLFWRC